MLVSPTEIKKIEFVLVFPTFIGMHDEQELISQLQSGQNEAF